MYQLSKKEVAIVTKDVESAGINFSHLGTDLIDHICCDIELRMDTGISFQQAYSVVKDDFGIKELQQIQKNTLMLIDKNYRIMKKSMKTIGVLAMIVMAFGALFKILHLPGAVILLAVSFFFTSLVFFPSLLYVMYKEVNKKTQAGLYITALLGGLAFMNGVWFKIMHWEGSNIMLVTGVLLIALVVLPGILVSKIKKSALSPKLLTLGFLPLIFFITGMLFKIMHWPGANILLMVGSLVLIVVFIPVFYRVEIRKSTTIRVDFIFALIALTYFVVMGALLQISESNNVVCYSGEQVNSYNELTKLLREENNRIVDSVNVGNVKEIDEVSELLCDKLDDLKRIIVQFNNKVDQATANIIMEGGHLLAEPYSHVYYLLPENNVNSPLIRLSEDILEYLQCYKEIEEQTRTGFQIESIFSLQDDSNTSGIAIHIFEDQTAASAMTQLAFWQYQIQLAQNIQLKALASNLEKQ